MYVLTEIVLPQNGSLYIVIILESKPEKWIKARSVMFRILIITSWVRVGSIWSRPELVSDKVIVLVHISEGHPSALHSRIWWF